MASKRIQNSLYRVGETVNDKRLYGGQIWLQKNVLFEMTSPIIWRNSKNAGVLNRINDWIVIWIQAVKKLKLQKDFGARRDDYWGKDI